jgi:hypothetical protein
MSQTPKTTTKDQPVSHDEPPVPDRTQLSMEQLDAVSAGGYLIRPAAGGGYEVLNDAGIVVHTATTAMDATMWCLANGPANR